MNKLYDYFSPYINDNDLAVIGSGEITKFAVSRSNRSLEVGIMLDSIVDYSVVVRVQKSLEKNHILKI